MTTMNQPANLHALLQASVQFDGTLPIDDIQTFGVLRVEAATSSETQTPLECVFTVDCSGSMSDMCADNRSKMQHIVHTLQNMVLFLREQTSATVFLSIAAFDSRIYTIVERTQLQADNVDAILAKIQTIRPRESTNLELALRHAGTLVQNLQTDYPTHSIHHVFLTDGEATEGSSDEDVLQSLVTKDAENAFIGFGVEHDAKLLRALGSVSRSKSSYLVIDKLENAGLVYGELLHSILYKVLTQAEVAVTNGQIYDYQTNTWVSVLTIPDIVSEANKTFHIKTATPETCVVMLRGTLECESVELRAVVINDATVSLKKHMYRQKTLELLYQANEHSLQHPCAHETIFATPMHRTIRMAEPPIKASLKALLEELKTYLESDECDDKPFVKNLCDDIYVCLKTLGTRHGTLFSAARQMAQGSQRQYTATNMDGVNDDETVRLTSVQLGRSLRRRRLGDVSEDDEEAFDVAWNLSDAMDTPYATQQGTQVMRFMSAPSRRDATQTL